MKNLPIYSLASALAVLGIMCLAPLATADTSSTTVYNGSTDAEPPIDINDTVGISPGDVYSSPLFCMPLNNHCINVVNARPATGQKIQTWLHSRNGNAGNNFEAIYSSAVTDTAPFKNTGFDKAYHGYAVVNLEFVNPATGGPSDLCVSTLNATRHTDPQGVEYYSPIELEPCSFPGKSDTNETFIVWNRDSSSGHRMEAVSLTNTTGKLQHLTCLFNTGTSGCKDGDDVIYSPIGGTPPVAHYGFAN